MGSVGEEESGREVVRDREVEERGIGGRRGAYRLAWKSATY